MMRKLLLSRQRPFQLALAWIGSFCGFFLVLGTLQYYLDFKELLTVKNDWIHPEYIVINKKVSLLSTLGKSRGFSEKEIEDLSALDIVNKLGRFNSNLFKASGNFMPETGDISGMQLYADLFFESLPAEFVDVRTESWSWQEGDPTVPIVVPADYLKLYNFGFAPSQNLPQISEKTLQTVTFGINIDSMGQPIKYRGRIAGFSNRIQSILVPESFLNYANKNFAGQTTAREPARLILSVKDPASRELSKYLDDHGYEANSEQLKNARLSNVLRIIALLLAGLALVIIFLSILGFIQYSQLALYRSAYEINTLLDIGMSPSKLFFFYARFSLLLLGGIAILAPLVLLLVKDKSLDWMAEHGVEMPAGLHPYVFVCAFFTFVLFLGFQLAAIRGGIYRFRKKK